MPAGALDGLRVLDLTTLLSAPQVAMMLGDLGADVVKIEPPSGDPIRRIGAMREGRSPQWAMLSRNKRTIRLDLHSDRDHALFERLVCRADVLVENLPDALRERWRCGYEDLSRLNPRLIVVSVSGYGRTGPYRDRPGAGSLAEAFGGLTHMTGSHDGPPMLGSIPAGDTIAAMSGVIGALAACYHRDAQRDVQRDAVAPDGAQGQHVDVAMYEPILALLGSTFAGWDGKLPAPMRSGSRLAGGVPRNTYRTNDGRWLVVSGTTDAQVARLLVAMGRDDDAHRARFGQSDARLAESDALDALVAEWIASLSQPDAIDALLAANVPAAPVNDLAAILEDPHVAARGSVVRIPDEGGSDVLMPAPAPRLSATPSSIRHAGAAPGAHEREIYLEWLDMNESELAALLTRSKSAPS